MASPSAGFLKTTLIDYPGIIASMIFFPGCNMECPYCYNGDLARGTIDREELVPLEEIFCHLDKRRNVIKGVVLSGGEALLSPYFLQTAQTVKEKGFLLKLDTNGMSPDKLKDILSDPKVRPDMISLDVKTSLQKYPKLTKLPAPDYLLKKTLEILSEDKFNQILNKTPEMKIEYRTVLVPGLVDKIEIEEIAPILDKETPWFFSPFKNEKCLDPEMEKTTPYSPEKIREIIDFACKFIKTASLR